MDHIVVLTDFTILSSNAIPVTCFSFPLLFSLPVGGKKKKKQSIDFSFERASKTIISSVVHLLHVEVLFFFFLKQ